MVSLSIFVVVTLSAGCRRGNWRHRRFRVLLWPSGSALCHNGKVSARTDGTPLREFAAGTDNSRYCNKLT
jgi:hypothetical protein